MNAYPNAVLPLALLATGTAAQPHVVVYGVADAGWVLERNSTGTSGMLGGGIASGSRLGVKASEHIGPGLQAKVILESGFGLDSGKAGQGGLLFGRQALVALVGQGTSVSLGRQYSPYFKVLSDVADPFATGLAGSSLNIFVGNTRVDNAVVVAASVGTLISTEILYGMGEAGGDGALSGNAQYTADGLTLALAYHRRNAEASMQPRTTLLSASERTSNSLLAAKYQWRRLTAHLAHATNRSTGGNHAWDAMLGVEYAAQSGKLILSWIEHQDHGPQQQAAKQIAVGGMYSLSPHTDLYFACGRIRNRGGTAFTVGNATDIGSGSSAVNLGMRHIF